MSTEKMTLEEAAKKGLTSMDVAEEKREGLRQLFPEVFTDNLIDFEQLRRVMGDWVEPSKERYGLSWPGKAECMKVIQAPSIATLKPSPAESAEFDQTENIFIEGDNLEALKLLQKAYFAKVKLIYIDPPYNTGKEFIYPDNYKEDLDTYLQYTGQKDAEGRKFSTNSDSVGRYHSNWLNMMYPRLYLARNLLRDDGIVMISIDENEFHNLKKLCDEVFGSSNYAGEIIWKNSSKNDQAYISIQHEYILCYVKNKEQNKGEWQERKEGLEDIYKAFDGFRALRGNDWASIHQDALDWYKQFPESNPISSNKHYSWMDERGVYFPDNISGPNFGQYVYDVVHPVTGQICKAPASGWRYPKETMIQRIKDGLVHFGTDHTTVPCNKTYLKNTENQSLSSVKFRDGRAASNRLKELFGLKVFTNPKDELLLKELFKAMGVSGDDLVLDFFAGSGSTAHAVYELNRETGSAVRSILIQLPENLEAMLETATGGAKKVVQNAIDYLTDKGLNLDVAEIAKERLRLIRASMPSDHLENADLLTDQSDAQALDMGFKVFKLSTTNFSEWFGSLDEVEKQLEMHVQHVDQNSGSDDILYELLLKAGFELTTKVDKLKMAGKDVYAIAGGALLICLDKEITAEVIDAMADADPLQVICLDEGFKGNDQLKTNAVQTFKSRAKDDEEAIVFRTI